jgi:hypothetical protein
LLVDPFDFPADFALIAADPRLVILELFLLELLFPVESWPFPEKDRHVIRPMKLQLCRIMYTITVEPYGLMLSKGEMAMIVPQMLQTYPRVLSMARKVNWRTGG